VVVPLAVACGVRRAGVGEGRWRLEQEKERRFVYRARLYFLLEME